MGSSPRVLVVNSGSSSLKYQLVEPEDGTVVAKGIVEKIGEPGGVPDHEAALREAIESLRGVDNPELFAGGHRVVHAGAAFGGPVRAHDGASAMIHALLPLDPAVSHY